MLTTKAEVDKMLNKFFEEKKELILNGSYSKVSNYKRNTCGLIQAQLKRVDAKGLKSFKFLDNEIAATDELREHLKTVGWQIIEKLEAL